MVKPFLSILLSLAITVLAGCQGSGRFVFEFPGIAFEIEFSWPAEQPLIGSLCGSAEIGGKLYVIFCDANGDPTAIKPVDDPGRYMPIKKLSEVVEPTQTVGLPENSSVFEIGDESYVTMNLPEELMDIDLSGTAEELVAEHGVIVKADGASLPYEYVYDEATDTLDVRFACTARVPLPDRFGFDNMYETVLVVGETEAFIYQRVVGDADEVHRYIEAIIGAAPSQPNSTPYPSLTD